MKNTVFPVLSIFVACVLAGCDYMREQDEGAPSPAERVRERERHDEQEAEFRANMSRFVEGKLALSRASLSPAEKSVGAVRTDIDAFAAVSAAAMNEKDAKGVALPLESRLLHLMQNPQVNALATRYLQTEFTRDAATFTEHIRTARTEERRYLDAKKKADALYVENIAESEKWLKMSQTQRDAEVERLKREITTLESSRRSVLKECENASRHQMHGPTDHANYGRNQGVRDRYEREDKLATLRRKLVDLDGEISKKRGQIDYLRNPDSNRNVETRAARQKQEAQRQAQYIHERSLSDIERNMKPRRKVVDIVTEYEQKTLGALQKEMTENLDKHQKEVDALKASIMKLEEAKLSIPVSSLDELKKLKASL